jgi:hypothetical protein
LKKANHYTLLKLALESGTIQSINDIQDIVPITILTVDMCLNYNTLSKRLLDPGKFTVADIHRLSVLTAIDASELFRKIVKEIRIKK